MTEDEIAVIVAMAVRNEREACAKVAESYEAFSGQDVDWVKEGIAEAIRKRTA